MPPQNTQPGQGPQQYQPDNGSGPDPATRQGSQLAGPPYTQHGILPAPPLGPNQLPQPILPAPVPGVQAIPQAAAAQNTAGTLPVIADDDPNSPRPALEQQISQVGDVSVQHAPGQQPQYGFQAPQQLQPLNVPSQGSPSVAYPPGKAPEAQPDRYAFFLDDKKQAKPTKLQSLSPNRLVPKGSSLFTRVLIFAVVAVVALMVAAVIISFIRGSKSDDTSGTLTGIIREQQEIIRINTLAEKTVTSTTLHNFVATAQPTIASDQHEMIAYANKLGGKISAKSLETYKADPKTDQVLSSAQAAGTYDAAFTTVMSGLLRDYQRDLQTVYKSSSSQPQKTLLQKDFTAAGLLLQMMTAQ